MPSAVLSVLVIDRSETPRTKRVSVPLLLAVLASVNPLGTVTVAELSTSPLKVETAVTVTVKVAVPPGNSETVVSMLSEPEAAAILEPLLAVAVQVTPVRPAGIASWTAAPVTALGPALLTVIVYTTWPPASTVPVGRLFSLVTLRSPWGVSVTLSVAELLLVFGSKKPVGGVTDAEFASVPMSVAAMVPVMVKEALPCHLSETLVLMLPMPEAATLEPLLAVAVQLTLLSASGKASTTVVPVTSLGPLFCTTRV